MKILQVALYVLSIASAIILGMNQSVKTAHLEIGAQLPDCNKRIKDEPKCIEILQNMNDDINLCKGNYVYYLSSPTPDLPNTLLIGTRTNSARCTGCTEVMDIVFEEIGKSPEGCRAVYP